MSEPPPTDASRAPTTRRRRAVGLVTIVAAIAAIAFIGRAPFHAHRCRAALEAGDAIGAAVHYDRHVRAAGREDPELLRSIATAVLVADLPLLLNDLADGIGPTAAAAATSPGVQSALASMGTDLPALRARARADDVEARAALAKLLVGAAARTRTAALAADALASIGGRRSLPSRETPAASIAGDPHRAAVLAWARAVVEEPFRPEITATAVSILGRWGEPGRDVALLGALAERTARSESLAEQRVLLTVGHALAELVERGPGVRGQAVSILDPLRNHPFPMIRLRTAASLAYLGDADGVAELHGLIEREAAATGDRSLERHIVLAAAFGLDRAGDPRGRELLVAAASQLTGIRRWRLLRSLVKGRQPPLLEPALPWARELLGRGRTGDLETTSLQVEALDVLAASGDRSDLRLLAPFLADGVAPRVERFRARRRAVAAAVALVLLAGP